MPTAAAWLENLAKEIESEIDFNGGLAIESRHATIHVILKDARVTIELDTERYDEKRQRKTFIGYFLDYKPNSNFLSRTIIRAAPHDPMLLKTMIEMAKEQTLVLNTVLHMLKSPSTVLWIEG